MPEPTPTDTEDAELIRRWLAGEETAATRLVERHAVPLGRYVASLGGRGDTEEVVQDTFVRAFGALGSFRGDASFRSWLFTIARRLLLDRRRAGRRRGEPVELHEESLTTGEDPLAGMVATETQARLAAAVGTLTPTQREVFTLRVTEGMSYREIAAVVGTSEGAARVHYHHAMRAVKEFLDA